MNPIGEVIQSSTRQWVAQVYPENEVPAFGAWVEVRRPSGVILYAVVSHIETGSVEPHRRPTALQMSREEIQREMPQVFALMRTLIYAQILAYRDANGQLRQTLSPRPADLHEAVFCCTETTIRDLHQPYDFLRTLARHPDPNVPADDLLVAVLQHLYAAHGPDTVGEKALIAAGRALARLLNDDHERLHSILRRVG